MSLTRMSHVVQGLTNLIEGMLERAAIERGRLSLRPEEVDLSELVIDTTMAMRPYAEQKALDLRVCGVSEPIVARADTRMVRLILSNLLGNAIKFTDGGFVEVELRERDGDVQLIVRDSGPGISFEEQIHVFDEFQQGEAGAEGPQVGFPGAGLGLALVRDMVEAMDGAVELESREGRGSTFYVTWPRQLMAGHDPADGGEPLPDEMPR